MKRLISVSLTALIGLSLITGCSTQNNLSFPSQELVAASSNDDLSNQYINTARALIDVMPKTKLSEQYKVIRDFERELKTLNRYALKGLIDYAVSVINGNLKPGQSTADSPVTKLIDSLNAKLYNTDGVYKNFRDGIQDIFLIAVEKNPQNQEKLIIDFGKFIKKIAKVDARELIKVVKSDGYTMDDYLDPNSPLAFRLIKMLEDRLK